MHNSDFHPWVTWVSTVPILSRDCGSSSRKWKFIRPWTLHFWVNSAPCEAHAKFLGHKQLYQFFFLELSALTLVKAFILRGNWPQLHGLALSKSMSRMLSPSATSVEMPAFNIISAMVQPWMKLLVKHCVFPERNKSELCNDLLTSSPSVAWELRDSSGSPWPSLTCWLGFLAVPGPSSPVVLLWWP